MLIWNLMFLNDMEVLKPPCFAINTVRNTQHILSLQRFTMSPTENISLYTTARSRAGRALDSQMRTFLPAAASYHQPHWAYISLWINRNRAQAKGKFFFSFLRARLNEGLGRSWNYYAAGKCQQQHNHIDRFRPVHKHINGLILFNPSRIDCIYSSFQLKSYTYKMLSKLQYPLWCTLLQKISWLIS